MGRVCYQWDYLLEADTTSTALEVGDFSMKSSKTCNSKIERIKQIGIYLLLGEVLLKLLQIFWIIRGGSIGCVYNMIKRAILVVFKLCQKIIECFQACFRVASVLSKVCFRAVLHQLKKQSS